jgi:hypothetical protein
MSAATVGVELLYRFLDTNRSCSRALSNDAPASLLNLDHSPIWAIPLELNKVKPGENESSLGNDYPDHFLRI